jgi:hypothetical protein
LTDVAAQSIRTRQKMETALELFKRTFKEMGYRVSSIDASCLLCVIPSPKTRSLSSGIANGAVSGETMPSALLVQMQIRGSRINYIILSMDESDEHESTSWHRIQFSSLNSLIEKLGRGAFSKSSSASGQVAQIK